MALQSFFYDQQIRRYIIQFIRMISNFQVQFGKDRENITTLQRVPVIYADSSRQVANILKENSENYLNSVPAMAVYVSGFTYDRGRVQNPTYVNKMVLREREYNTSTGTYNTQQGDIFNVERLMPVPYKLTLKVDIWTSNTEQKLQLLEQLCTLFNPALEIQNTDNYIDWSSITYVLLTDVQFSNRAIPIGTDIPIDIASLTFEIPIFINSPALIKKYGIIQKIIANIFDSAGNLDDSIYDNANLLSTQYFTPLQYGVILLDNQLTLVKYNEHVVSKFGQNIIKKFASNVSANTLLHLTDTIGIEEGQKVYGVRIRGPGSITCVNTSPVINGVNTSFLQGLSVATSVFNANGIFIGNVASITSNTSLTLTANANVNVTSNFYNFTESIGQVNVTVLSVNGQVVTVNKNITATAGDIISFNSITEEANGERQQWRNLINVYGSLQDGISQIKLETKTGGEIVGTVAYNPTDDAALIYNIDVDTVPANTLPPVNAIIDPTVERPNRDLQPLANGTRYLLVNDYSTPEVQPTYNWFGADSTPLVAKKHDIIQYNGNHWYVAFNSSLVAARQYMTNITTGIQYEWDGIQWQKSYQGYYEAGKWQLVL